MASPPGGKLRHAESSDSSGNENPEKAKDHLAWSDEDTNQNDLVPAEIVHWGPTALPNNGKGGLNAQDRLMILTNTGCKAATRNRPNWPGRMLTIVGPCENIPKAKNLAMACIIRSQVDGTRDEDREDTPGGEDDPIMTRDTPLTHNSNKERKKRKRDNARARRQGTYMMNDSTRQWVWYSGNPCNQLPGQWVPVITNLKDRRPSQSSSQSSWEQRIPAATPRCNTSRASDNDDRDARWAAMWKDHPTPRPRIHTSCQPAFPSPAARRADHPSPTETVSQARTNQSQPFNILLEY